MIPTFARRTLNLFLAFIYGSATAMIAAFVGGFGVGFGNNMGTMDSSAESLVYALSAILFLALYAVAIIKYRKMIFIQKVAVAPVKDL